MENQSQATVDGKLHDAKTSADDENHREIAAEFDRLNKVAPKWTDMQKREAVIDTFCMKWGMYRDEVGEIVDAFLQQHANQRKLPDKWIISPADQPKAGPVCCGDDEYSAIVRRCAEQGRALMQLLSNRGAPEPLYLYARESVPGRAGELFLVRDSAPNPNGYKLVTGEGLRISVPYDSYFQWVYERARSARILRID